MFVQIVVMCPPLFIRVGRVPPRPTLIVSDISGKPVQGIETRVERIRMHGLICASILWSGIGVDYVINVNA